MCDIYVMFVINRKENKTYANKIFYAEKKSLSTISEKRGHVLKVHANPAYCSPFVPFVV